MDMLREIKMGLELFFEASKPVTEGLLKGRLVRDNDMAFADPDIGGDPVDGEPLFKRESIIGPLIDGDSILMFVRDSFCVADDSSPFVNFSKASKDPTTNPEELLTYLNPSGRSSG